MNTNGIGKFINPVLIIIGFTFGLYETFDGKDPIASHLPFSFIISHPIGFVVITLILEGMTVSSLLLFFTFFQSDKKWEIPCWQNPSKTLHYFTQSIQFCYASSILFLSVGLSIFLINFVKFSKLNYWGFTVLLAGAELYLICKLFPVLFPWKFQSLEN